MFLQAPQGAIRRMPARSQSQLAATYGAKPLCAGDSVASSRKGDADRRRRLAFLLLQPLARNDQHGRPNGKVGRIVSLGDLRSNPAPEILGHAPEEEE